MLSKLNLLIITLIFFSCFFNEACSKKQGYYTIVAPGTVRSHSMFHVSISLSEFHQSCWFNVSLKGRRDEQIAFGSIEIQPGTTKLATLHVQNLIDKRGVLEVFGHRGIFSRDFAEINFEHDSYSAFIQTDKTKYKPGELVQFRAIFIDQLTRPAKIQDRISVLIFDGQRNLIKDISNVKLVQGVFKGQFQLSNHPVLGEWKIKVEVGGDDAAEKSFEVARYVLPKFFVKIDTKPNVAIDDGKIVLEISASYFYGEPVKGNLTLLLTNTYAAVTQKLPMLIKSSQIDGPTTIVLDLKNDLQIQSEKANKRSLKLFTLNAKASVIDGLSEQQSFTEADIGIYSQPYKILLHAPKMFDDESILNFKVNVSVTDLEDKSIQDDKTSTKIEVECKRSLVFDTEPYKSEHILPIGSKSTTIKLSNQNFTDCDLHAEYSRGISRKYRIKKNQDSLRLDILTESPEVGKELEIKLKSRDSIGNFSYEIVSRGDIIQSKLISVPGNDSTYVLRLNVTYSMVPKITIFVHRIKNMIFNGQLKDVFIKRVFENSLEIKTDDETKPGASLYINVTTDEESYVGLMALDQRILQTTKSRYDLSEDYVYTKLRNYDSISIDESSFPGLTAGLVTFSNAFAQFGPRIGEEYTPLIVGGAPGHRMPDLFEKPTIELPRIRKLFSDSWLYRDFEKSPAGGFNFMETVPDTITSWSITGFSLNPITGLTLTKNPTNLKVFQEFFVSMDLPSSVKAGESIEVPIYISNYMGQDVWTKVTIESDSEDLEIFNESGAAVKPDERISKLIRASGKEKLTFFIKPLTAEDFNVTVKAISSKASDAIQKTLNVKSEGIPHAITKTYLVHFPEESMQEDEITIDIPETSVPGSESVEISAVGDIFRPLTRSLQKLARVPYGNGEENMRYIISNLLVLKYFQALNYTNPSFESKIRLNLELGYQNQLSFKFLDGSFGRFNRTSRRTGDIWPTAFALWGLRQANNFIQVDSRILQRGLLYLKSKQQANGCFKSSNDIKEDVKHTAFALMVFLMDASSKVTYEDVITKGLAYLYEALDSLEQSSVSVMSTYVLLLGKHEKASDCLRKLTTNARLTSRQMLWKMADNLRSSLETTAGSLMNLFESQKTPRQTLLHIVKGLIVSEGGKSFITHVIALQAMIVFVEDLHLGKKNLDISFEDDQRGSGNFQVNSENSRLLQMVELSHSSRKIYLQSKGHGFAVVNIKYKYNIVPESQSSTSYGVNVTTKELASSLTGLEVCASFHPNKDHNSLTIMEVNLQSGYIFAEKVSEDVESLSEEVKSIQFNDGREKAVIYLENVENDGICLRLEAIKVYRVLNAKPGWVVVHSAHDEDKRTGRSFKIN